MFSAFMKSPVSGYLFILTAAAAIFLVWYIYNEGKQACENSNREAGLVAITTAVEDNQDIERQVNETPDLDKLLRDLGIMREPADR